MGSKEEREDEGGREGGMGSKEERDREREGWVARKRGMWRERDG